MMDGNGILHPRGCGIASHFGVLADVPTLGTAVPPGLCVAITRWLCVAMTRWLCVAMTRWVCVAVDVPCAGRYRGCCDACPLHRGCCDTCPLHRFAACVSTCLAPGVGKTFFHVDGLTKYSVLEQAKAENKVRGDSFPLVGESGRVRDCALHRHLVASCGSGVQCVVNTDCSCAGFLSGVGSRAAGVRHGIGTTRHCRVNETIPKGWL